ncbi:hypothetical protein [Crateriforma conspicua]|uniref:Uncharacterized protein n=1 Tax=Crateriforma conspicua TaxID=2527996 RepID=A0A5C5XZ54_9PLAN|nr:hypothetical protein [Crateriforma conspicua]QDV63399.1 hypothetical protein Mal65_25420 [Crateriforma conspicua]TWT67829.1 hypothetical protein Pan14r_00660 [Crateriforma conspicua]
MADVVAGWNDSNDSILVMGRRRVTGTPLARKSRYPDAEDSGCRHFDVPWFVVLKFDALKFDHD